MRIKMIFFAFHKEIVGDKEMDLDLPEGATVSDAWEKVAERFPKLKGGARSLMVSVNRELTQQGTRLKEGDEVAFLPPVSGG